MHERCGFETSSGTAEVFGNDMMISLGDFVEQVGSTDQQAGTLMHEFGHNIKLHHGGVWTDEINCKPNLVSVMSYSRQFPVLVADRELDFSNKILDYNTGPATDMLPEQYLDGTKGIESYSPHPEQEIVYGDTTGGLHWADTGEIPMPWGPNDINFLSNVSGCPSSPDQDLMGHDDWSAIDLNNKGTGNWADGVPSAGTGPPNTPTDRCESVAAIFAKPAIAHLPPQAQADEVLHYRMCAGGAGELTSTDVRAMRLLPIDSLENVILQLKPGDVHGDLSKIQQSYTADLNEVRELIMEDKIVQAVDKLNKIKETFDGLGEDLIKTKSAKGKLADITDRMQSSYSTTIPEFGTITTLVLVAAIAAIIAFSAKSRLSLIQKY